MRKRETSGVERCHQLSGSERPHAADAKRLKPLNAKEELTITIIVRAHPGSPPLPGHAHWQRTPPSRRTFLSVDAFTEKQGANQSDLEKVASFVKSQGVRSKK
jgi:hypothetical protein